ncbi:Aste57867_21159 [Aphanomyces stellatus]|uniref:Aste57867_21159 protein n=1 Tax=Aphanomyces stellatus TaxID=120398 RepID=A0A485LHE0_9STRA|nr:hypothetical protein As57867_021091 [Aphanomyces stellatus]VFT97833.1 Aste57867_21159 [Aphanomyces stellatus]
MHIPSLVAFFAAIMPLAHGCSDFLLNTTSDQVVSARTMDFTIDLRSLVEIVPRDTVVEELVVQGCPDCPNYAWRTKYGFVGLNTMGINAAADGLNEKGLSAGFLVLHASKYPAVNISDAVRRPIVSSIVTYILGNFATVDEVKANLTDVQLTQFDPKLQAIFSRPGERMMSSFLLHLPVHDAAGKSIVIEFLDGVVNIFDNPHGVLTNDPPLAKHLALVKALNNSALHDDTTFAGGYSSIERFQRLTILNRHADATFTANTSYSTATSDQAALAAAAHIINTVTIPTAFVGEGGSTQYTVIRDHKNLRFYFRSNENQILRSLDLNQIDFANAANRKAIDVNFGDWHVDVTAAVLQSTAHSLDLPPRSVVEGLLQKGGGSAAAATNAAAVASTKGSFWMGAFVGGASAALAAVVVMRGLSAGFLTLNSVYPTLNISDAIRRPVVASIVTYILGNFATTNEVKEGLSHVQLGQFDTAIQTMIAKDVTFKIQALPFHMPIQDASGHSIVIEFLNGTTNVYDNPNGVLTNDPPLLDQLVLVEAMDNLDRHALSRWLRTHRSIPTPDDLKSPCRRVLFAQHELQHRDG